MILRAVLLLLSEDDLNEEIRRGRVVRANGGWEVGF